MKLKQIAGEKGFGKTYRKQRELKYTFRTEQSNSLLLRAM